MTAGRLLRAAATAGLLAAGALTPATAAAAPGELDPGFAGDGTTTIDFTSALDSGWGLVAAPDGGTLVSGFAGGDMGVLRLLANGSLDPGFGTGGKTVADFGAPNAIGYDVALDPAGRIVVAGSVGNDEFGVARFAPTGGLDGELAGDGTVIGDFLAPGSSGRGVVPYPDGSIGVVGHALVGGTDYDFGAARLTPGGAYDSGFNGDGRILVDLGTNFDVGSDGVLQADGKLVIGGVTGSPGYDCGLARLTTGGEPDAGAFGPAGFVLRNARDREYCDGLAIGEQGQLAFAGRSEADSTQELLVGRVAGDGSYDASFAGSGFFIGPLDGPDSVSAAAFQPDGKLVAVGATGGGTSNFLIVRLNPDGTLDPTFSGDGIAAAAFEADAYATAVDVHADGDIVVAGSSDDEYAVARFQGGPLEVDLTAKRKQRARKLKATLYCSLPCEASLRGKGRAGGDKFKTKRATGAAAAAQTSQVRLKLKPRVRRELAGEKGKLKIALTATSGELQATDTVKVKLKP